MTDSIKNTALFGLVAILILGTGFIQSWDSALFILNFGLISAIMALGVNLQWGFAGLFNVGIMGFVALGGLAAVLVGMEPRTAAWSAGGFQVVLGLVLGAATITAAVLAQSRMTAGRNRTIVTWVIIIGGFFLYRYVFDGGVAAIEADEPARYGYLGGLGLPIIFAWPVGGLLAAGAAWIIGKTALGLRSDYLAIATLGISEIIIAVLKNEDWLSRGVKNVNGIPRPVAYEIDLQNDPTFVERAAGLGLDPVSASTLYVKVSYGVLFAIVLVIILVLAQLALKSPWGRMVRAIRDNETAARAMGKNVTARHLQIFVLGSAICGVAGAMMTSLDGLLAPSSYQPLRFTFLVWVMVIVGGSGNNFGSVLGGFLIWFLWVQVEPMGAFLATNLNDFAVWVQGYVETDQGGRTGRRLRFLAWLSGGLERISAHILENVQHMRLLTMGLIMLLVLRFAPRGLIPEK